LRDLEFCFPLIPLDAFFCTHNVYFLPLKGKKIKNKMLPKVSFNSTYPKVAVQWLNQALCPARAGFLLG
jgi:hypothetical protein